MTVRELAPTDQDWKHFCADAKGKELFNKGEDPEPLNDARET